MSAPSSSPRILALVICVVCALTIVARFPRWIRGPDEAYVVVAEDARHGRIGLHTYDEQAMAARTAALTDGRNRNFLAPTPPSIAVLLLPLAWMPQSLRPIVWLLLNLAAFLAACWLVHRTVTWPVRNPTLAVVVVAAVLLSEPLAENLARGQVYLLLMPSAAGILVAIANGSRAGAIGLAISTTAKLWGGAVWIALIAARQWRVLTIALAVTSALLTLGMYVVGFEAWSYYLRVVLPQWLSTPKMTVTAYQTIPSALAHFFRADPQWNPSPLVNLPSLGAFLTVISGLCLLGVTMWRAATPEHRLAGIAASIVLAVLFSPVAEQYHYLLVVPSIAIAIDVHGRHRPIHIGVLTIALVLLLFPLPFKSPELAQFAAGLFAYPRLAGALVLWALLVSPRRPVAADRVASVRGSIA